MSNDYCVLDTDIWFAPTTQDNNGYALKPSIFKAANARNIFFISKWWGRVPWDNIVLDRNNLYSFSTSGTKKIRNNFYFKISIVLSSYLSCSLDFRITTKLKQYKLLWNNQICSYFFFLIVVRVWLSCATHTQLSPLLWSDMEM